jgi:hypothetical protein
MRSLRIAALALCLLLPARTTHAVDRSGFTLLLSLGYGIQTGEIKNDTGTGLAGLNLGIGGFVSERAALMFKIAGTNVSYDYTIEPFGTYSTDVIAAVMVGDLQYWATDRLTMEFGLGFGIVDSESAWDAERGMGMLVGAAYSVLLREKHSLQVGVEYTPVFRDRSDTVHSIGFNVGFQFL